jgi:hypothetical protein
MPDREDSSDVFPASEGVRNSGTIVLPQLNRTVEGVRSSAVMFANASHSASIR